VRRLEVSGVWKSYPAWHREPQTLRGLLANRSASLARRGARRWVLEDVGFAVEPGEAVGVIGHNGAGKSTLLRLCSGLTRPTRGRVAVPAATASVLSLGSWFDPMLTGRENAESAAVVLGWTRRQARALLPAALAFAELEAFAAAPVRTYSDGMRLRLAFGVLAQLEPDLLVVDEALAVGDVVFQARCVERIREMRAAGTALLLASHDLGQVERECDRAVWLQRGRVRAAGPASEVVDAYRDAGRQETLARTPAPHAAAPQLGETRFGSQELIVEGGAVVAELPSGAPLTVELDLAPRRTGVADPQIIVEVRRAADDLVCHEASTAGGGLALGSVDGPVSVSLTVDALPLVPGDYFVSVGVYRSAWEYAYDYWWRWRPLRITGAPGAHGVVAARHRWVRQPTGSLAAG
jgi:lipopolysaccharide transport system ATP-binding protein